MAQECQLEKSSQNCTLKSENFIFEQNKLMTNYEGYWILKSRLRHVTYLYNKFYRKAAANKNLVDDDQKDKKVNRCMKRLLREEHRLLKIELVFRNGSEPKDETTEQKSSQSKPQKKRAREDVPLKKCTDDSNPSKKPVPEVGVIEKPMSTDEQPPNTQWTNDVIPKKKKKPGKYLGINYKDDPDIVLFEGFYVLKTATNRLNEVKEKLIKKGFPPKKLWKELRRECHKEERLLKKEKKKELKRECHKEERLLKKEKKEELRRECLNPNLDTVDAQVLPKPVPETDKFVPRHTQPKTNGFQNHMKLNTPTVTNVKPKLHAFFD